MQDFANKKIVLGICGGIAAYKSAYLVRELTRLGATVQVVMTRSAQEFITPLTMQALSGREVRCDLLDTQAERGMGHIELARWADYLLIAPASANCLAKLAHGIANDLLSTIALVTEAPVVVCPAMNRSMWAHPATVHNSKLLREREVMLVGPDEGSQACGEEGFGRMSDVETIIAAMRLHSVQHLLKGQRIMITAGPTREAIDPVRFISNHSSGKMGYALAEAARMAGAEVILISGPTALAPPAGVSFYSVQSASAMHRQVMTHFKAGMIFIGCAAVADFTVKAACEHKIKKKDKPSLTLNLTANPDIIAEIAASGKASYVVGFAAETSDLLKHAKEKLAAKKMNMIIANQVGEGMGFDKDGNQVTILTAESQTELPLAHKTRLAGQIIAILAATIQNGASIKERI
ncbi:bifunctional phosphopantothenoylcysteine decarboxylase/phosphopantothenate--cysteine ligase CoaBC [Legionella spiritensis]|uniref:Coenzyme A biosynthesis bifunctional protein CoaBC n=1 Tax=Legionella spiritensis TaxID=452 RepID=A0A0W0YYH4_LEGSP|nr:bifunctional phosphopantothenoylcysteine decarboxylase/phosphopantothenate--cysteine ligase CoaBC [Legionella spiritensis]KTD61924.1 bifunctional phosphopantothenoylcysteine decarboxylase/phosphopantothenate synthase [Legionella spiritensis]SNV31072.1 bifunctional phosphopantothenoylcysteine decarboxylase/phosphopantothenate synthase [Legionella spiritensis]